MIEKSNAALQSWVNNILHDNPPLEHIISDLHARNAQPYLVGGTVRDFFLGLPLKDIDIEVHGISLEELADALKRYGVVDYVGKSFGVLRVHGLPIDWSLPRQDTAGRKPQVIIDPHLSLHDAFRRRDLTMNAMGIHLVTGEFIDPFNGLADIQKKIMRTPDPSFFVQDPLRLFRVMQFISRFSMEPDETLNGVCSAMSLAGLSRERIEGEFEKMFLKSARPSLGIRWLDAIGRLSEILPELAATKGVPQNPQYHPEGDVFEHSMQALDEAASQTYETPQQRIAMLWAALCHDLGKVTTTAVGSDGELHSYGHEKESARLAKNLLWRLTRNRDCIKLVVTLVRYHMDPLNFIKSNAKAPAYKRLAQKLYPITTIDELCKLVMADRLGRKPQQSGYKPLLEDLEAFKAKAEEYRVLYQREEPLILGRDLLQELGAGPHLGQAVRFAYHQQLQRSLRDKEQLKAIVLKHFK